MILEVQPNDLFKFWIDIRIEKDLGFIKGKLQLLNFG